MKSRVCLIATLLCIAASSVLASAPVNVKDYLALRRKLLTSVPFETIKADAGSYIGKVIDTSTEILVVGNEI